MPMFKNKIEPQPKNSEGKTVSKISSIIPVPKLIDIPVKKDSTQPDNKDTSKPSISYFLIVGYATLYNIVNDNYSLQILYLDPTSTEAPIPGYKICYIDLTKDQYPSVVNLLEKNETLFIFPENKVIISGFVLRDSTKDVCEKKGIPWPPNVI